MINANMKSIQELQSRLAFTCFGSIRVLSNFTDLLGQLGLEIMNPRNMKQLNANPCITAGNLEYDAGWINPCIRYYDDLFNDNRSVPLESGITFGGMIVLWLKLIAAALILLVVDCLSAVTACLSPSWVRPAEELPVPGIVVKSRYSPVSAARPGTVLQNLGLWTGNRT